MTVRKNPLDACVPLIVSSLVILSVVSHIFIFNVKGHASEFEGNISLRQNAIPSLKCYYQDHTFVFEYQRYFIRVSPFVIYAGTYYNLKQIVTWIKTHYPTVDYKWLIKKAMSSIHYGFNLTRLPLEIIDKLDFVGFRLVDLNFPLSWFELEEINILDQVSLEHYNITCIHIPRAKLSLSFEDLYPYGYSIEHINSTYVLIGNISGRTNLCFDPVVLSDDHIAVTGYTKSSRCNFTEVYNADLSGTFLLADNLTQGQDQSLNVQVRPADSGALQLRLEVITYSTPKGDVTLYGKDFFNNNITESIEINAVGNYTTTKNYKSIDDGGIDIDPDITMDIWQPRWGVIELKERQVFLRTRIVIGDGSTLTYFKEEARQVIFYPYSAIVYYGIFEVKENASLQFGRLNVGKNILSSSGVDLIDGDAYTFLQSYIFVVRSGANLTWSFGSITTKKIQVTRKLLYPYVGSNTRMYFVRMDNVALRGAYDELYEINIVNLPTYALDHVDISEMTNVLISNCSYALYPMSGDRTFWNLKTENISSYTFYAFPSGNQYLINTEIEDWSFKPSSTGNGEYYRQYSFDLSVFHQNNTYAQASNVTISNSYLNTSSSWVINSNGSIPTQIFSMRHYNKTGGNLPYDYNPYNLTIKKSGFQTYTTLFNITKKEYLKITLLPEMKLPSYDSILNDEKSMLIGENLTITYKAENGTDTYIELFRDESKIIEDAMNSSSVEGIYIYDVTFDRTGEYMIHCFQNATNPILEDWISVTVREQFWFENPTNFVIIVGVIVLIFVAIKIFSDVGKRF